MSQKETKYICYTGIGSNKTGTHTAKDFLKRMEKNRNNFNEPTPKSVKTLDQWVKNSGASYGKCSKSTVKTMNSPALPIKYAKKMCRKECKESEKQMPLIMKALGLNKKEIKEKIKTYKKDCEKNCVRLTTDEKLMKQLIRMKLKGGCIAKRGGGKKLSQSEFKKLISEKGKEYWDEYYKCTRKCNKIKTNYAKNKKNLKKKSKCHKKCQDKRLKNIRTVHKKYPKEFKTFVKNLAEEDKKIKKTIHKAKLWGGDKKIKKEEISLIT